MSDLKLPTAFFIVFAFLVVIFICSSSIIGASKLRTASKCSSTIKILDCDLEDPLIFSRRYLNLINAQYVQDPNCVLKRLDFHWDIILENGTRVAFDSYKYGGTFHLKPYSVSGGEHHVMVFAIGNYDGEFSSESDGCAFTIIPENPVPIIQGGSEITAESGQPLIMDGRDSVDMEVPSNKKGHLEYNWKCSESGSNVILPKFCTKEFKNDVLTVPAKFVLNNLVYTFDLSVKSKDSDWVSTRQIVKIKTSVSVLRIKCLKNCSPIVLVTNVKEPTIVQVDCTKNCHGIKEKSYLWSISEDDFDYTKNAKFGRNKKIFYIIEDSLLVSKKYTITVKLQDNLIGDASTEIETHQPPQLEDCSISPESGEALKTPFVVHCLHPKGQYMFEVYSKINNAEILLERNSRLKSISFVLPANAEVKVKIIDEYEHADFQILSVAVTNSLNASLTKEELIKHVDSTYFDKNSEFSLTEMMQDHKYDKVIQTFNVLCQELASISENKDLEETVLKYKMNILDTLEKIPLESRKYIKQVSGITKELAEQTVAKQNPEIAKKSSQICKKAAEKNVELFRQERFLGSFSEEATEDSKIFSDCSQVGLIPNWGVLVSPEIFVPPTPYPLLNFPQVDENYPDYVDENVTKSLSKLDSYVKNLVETCFVNGKSLLDHLVPYESSKFIESENFNVTATKKFGKFVPLMGIFSQNVIVRPSADFSDHDDSEIEILFCTSGKNPYWWKIKPTLAAPVAFLQFQMGGKVVNKFSKPFLISFELSTNESSEAINSGLAPRKPKNLTDPKDYDFEKMAMYRIDVYQNQNYFIEFLDLGTNVLNVYVTTFFKPSLEKFRSNSIKVNVNKSKIFIENNLNYDHWDYMTVLGIDIEDNSGEVSFKYKINTPACYSWSVENNKWEISCKGTNASTSKYIECLCYKSSVISARIESNRLREENTLYVKHKLEVQASFVIFLTVLIVWTLYCALLVYFSLTGRKQKNQEIYFLSDVPTFYRYGYIVIIKTGNKNHAGTTSNVVIKIYGSTSESKEHLLNFPDPDKRLLQKNQEDWFFLATEHYLGDIKEIELWFDSIGYRPSWFCSEIEIADLQMKKYWRFLVNFRFEIQHSENHYYRARPIQKEDDEKSKNTLKKISSALHGCHMWNICQDETYLSKITRITLMLSIFLTNFTILLLLYGFPILKPSDSIGEYIQYSFHFKIIWAAIVSAILTFIVHYPIIYIFRRIDMDQKDSIKRNKTNKNNLNNWICWSTLIFLIVLSMTVTLIFGFWVPHVTSLIWLSSAITSLIIYIFLLENMVLIFRYLTLKTRSRMKQIFSKISYLIDYVETQRDVLYDKFGKYGLRPYFKHLYKPLDSDKIAEIKYLALLKEKVIQIFEDILAIALYVILLYTIILLDKDAMAANSNQEINDLIQGVHSRTYSQYIHGRKEIEKYIVYTSIHSLQSPQWYGKFLSKDPGMTVDNSNKYIGIARLRQHRSDNTSCNVVPITFFVKKTCVSQFSEGPEYRNFGEDWKNDSIDDKLGRMGTVWKYQEAVKTGSFGSVGKFARYPGGGYVATLGRTLKNSLININYLSRHEWIDKFTRCLFIEFLTYSANTNIFNSVTVTFEISTTGYIRTGYNIYTTRLLFAKENFGILWILFGSFIIIVTILTIKLIRKVIKLKKMVLKEIWGVLDIFIIAMSVLCMFFYVNRSRLVGEFLDRIEKAKRNEFINYFHLFYAETILTILAAILVFLATLRLWKLLRFFVLIRVVEKTLVLSAIPLFCLCLCHIHLIVVFSISGFLIFGDKYGDFKNIPDAFMSLVLGSIGFFGFDFDIFDNSLHYIYFTAYKLLNMLVITIYVTIIMIYYSQSQNFYSNYEEYSVLNVIKENFEYYKEVFKARFKKNKRLTGGEDKIIDEKTLVFPKSDEHRYAKCLRLEKHKIEEMRQITLNALRNSKIKKPILTDNDVKLIKETVVTVFKASKNEENDYFFLSNCEGYRTKLIDDLTFLKMEETVNSVFCKKDKIKKLSLYETVIEDNKQQMDRILKNLKIAKNGLNSLVL